MLYLKTMLSVATKMNRLGVSLVIVSALIAAAAAIGEKSHNIILFALLSS